MDREEFSLAGRDTRVKKAGQMLIGACGIGHRALRLNSMSHPCTDTNARRVVRLQE